MVTNDALGELRKHFKESIDYAAYVVGTEERRAETFNAELMDDGRISVVFTLKTSAKPGEVATKVKLYGTDGKCWAENDENISLASEGQAQGVSYRFRFSIMEGAN